MYHTMLAVSTDEHLLLLHPHSLQLALSPLITVSNISLTLS